MTEIAQSSDAWYYPHITRKLYKTVSEILSRQPTCTVEDLVLHVTQAHPSMNVSALKQRIHTAIHSLIITGDIEVVEELTEKKTRKKVITKVYFV